MRSLPHPCSTVQQLESDLELNKTASFLLEFGDLQCKVDLSGGWTEEMGPPLSQSCSGSTPKLVKVQDTESQIREGFPIGK